MDLGVWLIMDLGSRVSDLGFRFYKVLECMLISLVMFLDLG